jgi:hypothetical protein
VVGISKNLVSPSTGDPQEEYVYRCPATDDHMHAAGFHAQQVAWLQPDENAIHFQVEPAP